MPHYPILPSLAARPRGVAFSDTRKYDRSVRGLQDNLAIAFNWLASRSGFLRWLLRYQWSHTMNQLLLVLGLAFSVLWDQVSG